jgi:hypothetical protein
VRPGAFDRDAAAVRKSPPFRNLDFELAFQIFSGQRRLGIFNIFGRSGGDDFAAVRSGERA